MSDQTLPSDNNGASRMSVKAWALGLLLLNLLLWLSCVWLMRRHPEWIALAYVKAFAEAACIGAMADWFAVVALFRHPLGLPLPHTAILPQKQAQLAKGVADFVGTHFLDPQRVGQQITEYRVGERFAQYVQNHFNLAFVQQRLPLVLQFLHAKLPPELPDSWWHYLQAQLATRLSGAKVGGAIAKIVQWAQQERMDAWLINRLARALHDFCSREDAAAVLQPWLHELATQAQANSSWWDKFKAQMTGSATDWLIEWLTVKAIGSGRGLAERVLAQPDHPIHQWFQAQCTVWQQQLREDDTLHAWLHQQLGDVLKHPMSQTWFAEQWQLIHHWMYHASQPDTTVVKVMAHSVHERLNDILLQPQRQHQLTDFIAQLSTQILSREQTTLRQWMSNELSAWSKDRLNHALEGAIGKDLQYIRINGTLIGGLIGVLLYTVSHLF